MNKPNDLSSRAAALGRSRNDLGETKGQHTTTSKPVPPRTKPVRVSTDLSPQAYKQLARYCGELAENLGRTTSVPKVAVLRALIEELNTNTELRTQILTRVSDEYDENR